MLVKRSASGYPETVRSLIEGIELPLRMEPRAPTHTAGAPT
jgi:hypothetical protein